MTYCGEPNGTCGWSKSNKRSPEPSAVRRAQRLSVAFAVICPPCASRGMPYWWHSLLSLLVNPCLSLGHPCSYNTSILILHKTSRRTYEPCVDAFTYRWSSSSNFSAYLDGIKQLF